MKVSRHTVLSTVVIVVLLASIPRAIWRIIETRDQYLFTEQFFADLLGRLSGPGRLRFIVQPLVAVILGAKDGLRDARLGLPPFLWALLFHGPVRKQFLRGAMVSVQDLVCVAVLLDLISQALIFHEIRPGAALVVGPVLIAVPYCTARALGNRVLRKRQAGARAARAR